MYTYKSLVIDGLKDFSKTINLMDVKKNNKSYPILYEEKDFDSEDKLEMCTLAYTKKVMIRKDRMFVNFSLIEGKCNFIEYALSNFKYVILKPLFQDNVSLKGFYVDFSNEDDDMEKYKIKKVEYKNGYREY